MKKTFLLLFLFIGLYSSAQCEYAVTIENENGGEDKLTQEQIVYYRLSPLSTEIVSFSLYIENNIPLVLFKYSRDSNSFPPSICIDNKSRLSFQLSNGEIVSMRQAGEESCGYIDNPEGLDKKNHTLESFFYLSPDVIKKLKESKITFMGLRTPSDERDFVIASELDLQNGKAPYIPGNYFIENLSCIGV